MKKTINILFILVTISMFLFLLCGCKNKKENKQQELKKKVSAELLYIENELVCMANELNNISYLNYKVVTNKTEGSASGEQGKQSSNGQESGGQNSESQNSIGQGGQQGETSKENSSSEGQSGSSKKSKSEDENKVYSMISNNLLERDTNIEWSELKEKTEKLYSTLPLIYSELKELGVSEEDIEKFSNTIDNITVAVINEQKDELMDNIVNGYSYIPQFAKKCEEEGMNEKIFYLKYLLLVCYRDVNKNEWDSLANDINNLKLSYSNFKQSKELGSNKEVNLKKGESIIDEMKNCVNVKNQDMFFIKYKNLMQELNLLCNQ